MKNMDIVFRVALLLLTLVGRQQCQGQTVRRLLIESLLLDYESEVRPVASLNSTSNVSIALTLNRFIRSNEAEGWIQIVITLEKEWNDVALQWDPADYQNTTEVIIDADMIWVPNIISEQIIDTERSYDIQQLIIRADGTVLMEESATITILCDYQVQDYPYDVQHCDIIFISHLYDITELRMSMMEEAPTTIENTDSPEWNIYKLAGVIGNRTWFYDGRDWSWHKAIFRLSLRRKGAFYWWTLILPTSTITLLIVVGIFTPSTSLHGRPERVTMALTAILSVAVFLLIVSDSMPKNPHQFPSLGWFIISQLVLIIVAVAVSTIWLIMQSREHFQQNPPVWLLKLCRIRTSISYGDEGEKGWEGRQKRGSLDDHVLQTRSDGKKTPLMMFHNLRLEVDKLCLLGQRELTSVKEAAHRHEQWVILGFTVDCALCIVFLLIQLTLIILFSCKVI